MTAICPICRTVCGRRALECLIDRQSGYEERLQRLEAVLVSPAKKRVSTRQQQVAVLVEQGYTSVAIAERLGITVSTVKSDRFILQKTARREAAHASEG